MKFILIELFFTFRSHCKDSFIGTSTLERLAKRGYESLLSYYEKVSPLFHEPSRYIGMV